MISEKGHWAGDGETLRLRTMTLKSKIGFGTTPDSTVGVLIASRKHIKLILMYYKLERINFNQEVKDALHITPEREIPKPGKSVATLKRLMIEFRAEFMYDERRAKAIDRSAKTVIKNIMRMSKSAHMKEQQSGQCYMRKRWK